MARIMLRRSRVEMLYAGEDIAAGSSGVLQLGMLEVLAEYESALDGKRIRDGIRKNAERCMDNGCVRYGWDNVDGRYVVNEGEAAVVRMGVRMILEGKSVADVVRAWEPYRTKRGGRWRYQTVRRILLRRENGGEYGYAGVTVPGGMPAIVPMGGRGEGDEDFERQAQAAHEGRGELVRPHGQAVRRGGRLADDGDERDQQVGRDVPLLPLPRLRPHDWARGRRGTGGGRRPRGPWQPRESREDSRAARGRRVGTRGRAEAERAHRGRARRHRGLVLEHLDGHRVGHRAAGRQGAHRRAQEQAGHPARGAVRDQGGRGRRARSRPRSVLAGSHGTGHGRRVDPAHVRVQGGARRPRRRRRAEHHLHVRQPVRGRQSRPRRPAGRGGRGVRSIGGAVHHVRSAAGRPVRPAFFCSPPVA